ncbi:MAG: hypothetical protein CK424_08055 [Legionella sp.]|nr:MAG: hypothetical protein CK424_08055 [Legionella sp.]
MSEWSVLAETLRSRLPELERQIQKLGSKFPLKALPKGLFRQRQSGSQCILEIEQELDELLSDKPNAILEYLAVRLSRKIHILVHICLSNRQPFTSAPATLDALSTREQWLSQLDLMRSKLDIQRAAVEATLQTMLLRQDSQAILVLQKELSDIDRQFELLFAGLT